MWWIITAAESYASEGSLLAGSVPLSRDGVDGTVGQTENQHVSQFLES
jgi:hypothetical protein